MTDDGKTPKLQKTFSPNKTKSTQSRITIDFQQV